MKLLLIIFFIFKSSLAYIVCPYCDPNYLASPNLDEAMRGYDVPMGNPNPGQGKSDPGIRNQIFSPMVRNEDGHYKLNSQFVTANPQIKCDASWKTEVYDTFKDYVNGKMLASTTGYGIEVGPTMNAEVNHLGGLSGAQDGSRNENDRKDIDSKVDKVKNDLETEKLSHQMDFSFPHLFSRSWVHEREVDKIADFFAKEKGAIAVSEAVCLTHKIDIADKSQKVFIEPFLDGVKALAKAKTSLEKLEEFKSFVNSFGTHYPSSVEMGTKITIERRYSANERTSSTLDEIRSCNKMSGARLLGFQSESNYYNCTNGELRKDQLKSRYVERTVISTFGSFIAASLGDWTRQVIELFQGNNFNPRPIRRELKIISRLFLDKTFENMVLDDGSQVNGSSIVDWFIPMMMNYCTVFNVTCNRTGCGIDDDCDRSQICRDLPNGKVMCEPRVVNGILPSGDRYIGPINSDYSPNGIGVEMYQSGSIKYIGEYKKGWRSGVGKQFYKNGNLAYNGTFKNGFKEGIGTAYFNVDSEHPKPSIKGIFKRGKLDTGIYLSKDSGQVRAALINGSVLAGVGIMENFTERVPLRFITLIPEEDQKSRVN